jgi:hypothetical protein
MKKQFFLCSFCLLLSVFSFAQGYNVSIRSASVQVLYRQCENPLYFDVANICGEEYNPKVVATNARVRQDSTQSNKFCIMPETGNSCLLTLYNQKEGQEIKIGEEKVKVIEPPKPAIFITINGQPYTPKLTVKRGSKIRIQLKVDEDFAASLPKEARYAISEIRIYNGNSCGGPHLIMTIPCNNVVHHNGMEITLPSECFGGYLGRSYVDIGDIYRVNSKGQRIKDNRFTPYERTLVISTSY